MNTSQIALSTGNVKESGHPPSGLALSFLGISGKRPEYIPLRFQRPYQHR